MGRLLLKDKVNFFFFWFCFSPGLMMMFSAAEREHFHLPGPLSWDMARNHCQVCFTDLATVTPENIQTIIKNVTSESWIGLRKNFSSTDTADSDTSRTSMSWSRWADSALLTFQNWYPGWPVKSSSCTCTCPAATSTWKTDFTTQDATSFTGKENTNLEAQCVWSPTLTPDVIQTYIEDSCVAMLSFGAWIEKQCSDPLPFICYDESFVSSVAVTDVTSSSANLKWQPGPGHVNDYRVVVRDQELIKTGANDASLVNLTAGTRYSVQVFAVKCNRRLSSEEVSFYTIPGKVLNLTTINETETSVTLIWDKPSGNVSFYIIKYQDQEIKSNDTIEVVNGLTPGGLHTFNILSGVSDRDTRSKEKTITTYTKPGKVSDLNVTEQTMTTLLFSWSPPAGNTSVYLVTIEKDGKNETTNVTKAELRVEDLSPGMKVTLRVKALIDCSRMGNEETDNCTLAGQEETFESNTVPGSISNLTLNPSNDSISATWNKPENSSYSHFRVIVQLEGFDERKIFSVTGLKEKFEGLRTAANYTVSVSTVQGNFRSKEVMKSVFTLPSRPAGLRVSHANKTSLTLNWTAPVGAAAATYIVNISSNFDSNNYTAPVEGKTSHTFSGLMSGTKYTIDVRMVADEKQSEPQTVSHSTDPDIREIGLSMLCSSDISLYCDKSTTREMVIKEFEEYLKRELKDNIFWELKKNT